MEPGQAVLAGLASGLAPFRANRRPGPPAGRGPGEPPYGGADHAPIWLESLMRLLLHALWAAAAAAGGAQLTPHLVGGANNAQEEPPQVARMVHRLEALLAVAEAGGAGSRAEARGLQGWEQVAGPAAAIACLGLILWQAAVRLSRSNTIGARARALMELSIALEQGGDNAAERMAEAAGVSTRAVYDWHAAWKVAWRGPG